jgi:antitoxin ChpS
MLLTTLRNVGGSVMFAIPRSILEGLGLSPNSQVGLSVSDGRLIVEPRPRPRYTLAELMDQCDLSAPVTDESRLWLDAQPIGREIP